MTIDKRLKRAMAKAEITQKDLSIKTGIGKSSISHYLAGRATPSKDRLLLIADALEVDVEYFTLDEIIDEDEELKDLDLDLSHYSNVPVVVAAKILGAAPNFVRNSLKAGTAPFGFAAKGHKNWSFHISPSKFREYVGK